MVSGFCSVGFHEGTSPKSPSGKPCKVCTDYEGCPCDCHHRITKMCEASGITRTPYQNPQYKPYKSGIFEFLETYRQDAAVELLAGGASTHRVVEEKPFTTPDGTEVAGLRVSGRSFEPNARGRGSGQLEDQVRQVVNRYMTGEFSELCTPKFVSLVIDPDNPPSVGAIGAVFDRWEKMGFAIIERNPIRFMTLTVDGLTKGLEQMKEESKRIRRSERHRR